VWITVAVITFAQFALTYTPPLQTVFATLIVTTKAKVLKSHKRQSLF
jgi:hypothetical protein